MPGSLDALLAGVGRPFYSRMETNCLVLFQPIGKRDDLEQSGAAAAILGLFLQGHNLHGANAARFPWDNVARETLAVYAAIAS